MFDIIDRPECYPQFLPWCRSATLLERSDTVTSARLDIDYKGLHMQFTTRNPKVRPNQMLIELVDGPFTAFQGEWRLIPLAAGACRVDFSLHYAFRHNVITALSGHVFEHIADTLVDAFVARALEPCATSPAGT